MIPIGPIVWVAMAAARSARSNNAPPPSSGPLSLRHVLLWGFSLGVSMLAYGAVVAYPALWPLYLLFLTGVACLLFPWWMSRILIIPLGLPKLAFQLNRLAAVAWGWR